MIISRERAELNCPTDVGEHVNVSTKSRPVAG